MNMVIFTETNCVLLGLAPLGKAFTDLDDDGQEWDEDKVDLYTATHRGGVDSSHLLMPRALHSQSSW